MNSDYSLKLRVLKQVVDEKKAELLKAEDELEVEKRAVAQNLVNDIVHEYGEELLTHIEAVLTNRKNKGSTTSMISMSSRIVANDYN